MKCTLVVKVLSPVCSFPEAALKIHHTPESSFGASPHVFDFKGCPSWGGEESVRKERREIKVSEERLLILGPKEWIQCIFCTM